MLEGDIFEYYAKIPKHPIGTNLELLLSEIIIPKYDSRAVPGEINSEFIENIRQYGQWDHVHVVELTNGKYELVNGRRRYKALCAIKFPTIKATLQAPPSNADDPILLIKAYLTNKLHQELTPFETVMIIKELFDKNQKQKDIAKYLAITEAYVSQVLKIFRLPEKIVEAFKTDKFGNNAIGKCRYLSKIDLNEVDIIERIAETAFKVDATVVNSIVDAYLYTKMKKVRIAPELVDMVIAGRLEPESKKRLEVLNKLKEFEQQIELANIIIKKTKEAIDDKEAGDNVSPPSIEEINEWILAIREAMSDFQTPDENSSPKQDITYEFKVLTPDQIQEKYEYYNKKYEIEKNKTDVSMSILIELKGIIEGIKVAGGYTKI